MDCGDVRTCMAAMLVNKYSRLNGTKVLCRGRPLGAGSGKPPGAGGFEERFRRAIKPRNNGLQHPWQKDRMDPSHKLSTSGMSSPPQRSSPNVRPERTPLKLA